MQTETKSTMKTLTIILLLITNPIFGVINKSPIPEETLLFEIIYKGDRIGTLKAERFQIKNKMVYTSSTRINTTILLIKKINVRYKYRVTYNAGRLRSSKVNIKINKRKPKQVLVNQKGDDYVVKFSDGKRNKVTDLIDISSIKLYFDEPDNVDKIFSEQLGNFNEIVKIREGLYKMVNEKGNENFYHYTNGKLDKIEVDGGMVSFEMRAKE